MPADLLRHATSRLQTAVTTQTSALTLKQILLNGIITAFVCASSLSGSASAGHSASNDDSFRLTQFQGELSERTDQEGAILRRFEVLLLSSHVGHFFHVLDDSRAGCAWPDSFGTTDGNSASATQPHLLYTYDGTRYSIGLPPLVIALPDQIEIDSSWEQDGWNMTALEKRTLDGTECWVIEAKERRGRRQSLTAAAHSGVLIRAQADVFMGQGDQFRLTLNQTASQNTSEAVAAVLPELQQKLLSLQKALNRRPDSQLSELSSRQVAIVLAEQPQLHKLAEGTPLQELVLRLSTDVARQQERVTASRTRAGQLINSAAPEFSLNLVSGGTLDSDALRGKVVVLHFWDYRDQPLSEPYGQTGYLDFIYNQRRKLNVQVVGVSTSTDFQAADTLGRARRSVRKLAEFMNLTYPIAYDDGSLLRSLGDPRDSNGQLPLWVVLTPDGKVGHYHAGYYEIDAARGLQQLDDALIKLLGK